MSMTPGQTPSNRSLAARGRPWSPERWTKFTASRLPAKPDPDVLAIAAAFGITYYRARILKALSYGIPVESSLIAWAAGLKPTSDDGYREIACLPLMVPIVTIRGRTGAVKYIIHDQASLDLIRRAMQP